MQEETTVQISEASPLASPIIIILVCLQITLVISIQIAVSPIIKPFYPPDICGANPIGHSCPIMSSGFITIMEMKPDTVWEALFLTVRSMVISDWIIAISQGAIPVIESSGLLRETSDFKTGGYLNELK